MAQKIAFEAKGRQCITGKVIQRLFNIDLYTYLATYPYRWSKRKDIFFEKMLHMFARSKFPAKFLLIPRQIKKCTPNG